jgi:hypothetical protein
MQELSNKSESLKSQLMRLLIPEVILGKYDFFEVVEYPETMIALL